MFCNIPLQREFGDSKRIFGERRRNDSYTEEEPEWFSAGPTSQSETIELTGFDDKILEEDHKGRKRTRRRTASLKEGNGKFDEKLTCLLAFIELLRLEKTSKIIKSNRQPITTMPTKWYGVLLDVEVLVTDPGKCKE